MRRKKEYSLKQLKEQLVDVSREIALIEANYINLTKIGYTHTLNNNAGLFSEDMGAKNLDNSAFDSVIFDADYIDSKLAKLKKEKSKLESQIDALEKSNESEQFGK